MPQKQTCRNNYPALTIKQGSIRFNTAAIRKLDGCFYVNLLINADKQKLMVKPCADDDANAVKWRRYGTPDTLISRLVKCKLFTTHLFDMMQWDDEAIMKVPGTTIKSKTEKVIEFDLTA